MTNNNYNYNYSKYSEKRKKDIKVEKACASFVDKYWYSKYQLEYKRIADTDPLNKLGEDVEVRIGNSLFKIDEKAKLQSGMLNKVIMYPSFEIICKDKEFRHYFDSWFVTPRNINNTYAIISASTSIYTPEGDEWKLGADDYDCMVYGIIDKDKIHDFVEAETGRTIQQITDDAYELVDDFVEKSRYMDNLYKTYRRDGIGPYIYLKLSGKRKEQPVNLVVRRDVIRNNNLISEVYIDKDKVCKYRGFDRLYKYGEPLERKVA